MTDSFREDFLANIAKTLGVSAADMSAETEARYSQGALYERALRQQEAIRRQATTWADILYDKYVTDAVMRAYIKLPLADEIRYITGYHPQRLLEHKPEITTTRSTVRYEDGSIESLTVTRGAMRTYEKSEPWPFEKFFHRDLGEEYISFSDMPKLTRYYIEGGHFDMYDREPRRLAPFVSPTGRRRLEPTFMPMGRISYPTLTKPANVGKSHMAVITGADYAAVERQILAAMDLASVRCLVLDLDSPGGEIPRNPQQELYARGTFDEMLADARDRSRRLYENKPIFEDVDAVVDTAAGKRDKSYLKHDPSKSHKRRKRK